MTIDLNITREGSDGIEFDIDVVCDFDVIEASKGARGSYGEPVEPDEPMDVEFLAATADGVDIELTDNEIEEAKNKAIDSVLR